MDTMEQWFLPGFLALSMVLGEGPTCDFSPECYKQSEESTTYTCEWSPQFVKNATYELFFRRSNSTADTSLGSSNSSYIHVTDDKLITKVSVDVWVVAHTKYKSCNSFTFSGILSERVKYGAPQMISMSRTSSNLTLRWGNKKGDAVDVEVRRRENSSGTWVRLDLQHQQVYQLQLRQKSKIAKHPLWSDWTPILNVPTEIQDPPEVNWTVVDFSNGTRLLKLNWGISTYPVSVGQVNYNLSLHIWPCQTNQKNWSNIKSTEFNVSVTYSAVSGSIAAFNKVGNVQQRNFLIPAKHLTNCSKAWRIDKPTPHKYVPVLKKSCLEWYKLTDGETSPHKVNIIVKQVNETLQTIRKEMDDYLPYYYFVHHQSDKRLPQTIEMCLMYKMEGVPRKAPENVTVHSTTTSAVLHWNHIPLSHRQGFLTYYKICYRRTQNGKECHNISASETEYSIQNLTPQSTYEIQLSGGTVAGFGPPETINIFPPIPRPVVVEYSIFRVRNQVRSI
uniref:Fibronectin type-III domain-containing protein n=1 Tax=Esox lucius TaxID=8010 RepID=A0A3P8ZZ50_ESOLU